MRVRFTKMQGAGNDFVVLDATRGPLELGAARVRALADLTTRHLAGWPTQTAPDAAALVASKQAALALGAKD